MPVQAAVAMAMVAMHMHGRSFDVVSSPLPAISKCDTDRRMLVMCLHVESVYCKPLISPHSPATTIYYYYPTTAIIIVLLPAIIDIVSLCAIYVLQVVGATNWMR